MIFFGHIVALGAVVYPFLYLNCVVGSLSSLSAGKTTVAFYYALGPFGLLLIMAILFISFFALMRLDEKRKKKR